MVDEAIVKDVLSCFLGGQRDECKVIVSIRFGKREYLYFMAIVIGILHDAPEYVGSRVIAEDLTLKM